MEQKELVELITRKVLDALRLQELQEKASNSYGPPRYGADGLRMIPLAISNRHIHLSQQDQDILFGPGTPMNIRNPLYQKGEYACKETVTVIGPNERKIERVRVLGPPRKGTQVELARTDAVHLGMDLPVGVSVQHIQGSGITIVGPKGTVKCMCAICPSRHIHMSPDDAMHFGVQHEEKVKVHIPGEKASLLENVFCRVHKNFSLEMHLDTDDGNACLIKSGMFGSMKK